MTWLTWRQFRAQALTIAVLIAAVAVTAAVTGPELARAFHADRAGFLRGISGGRLDTVIYQLGLVVLYAVPPLIGAFWGAPLIAREFDAGTQHLVWNQGVSRTRWLATKLGVLGLGVLAATGALSLAVSCWAEPIDRAIDGGGREGTFTMPRMAPLVFGARGVVPLGYAVLAFAVGVTAGLVLRRSVAALAVTLVLVVAVQVAMPVVVREHLAPPEVRIVRLGAANLDGLMISGDPADGDVGRVRSVRVMSRAPGDWVVANVTVDAAGTVQSSLPGWVEQCGGAPGPVVTGAGTARQQACFSRLAGEGYRQRLTYQPAARFWTLQWREFAVLAAVALLLAGFCFRRIRGDVA